MKSFTIFSVAVRPEVFICTTNNQNQKGKFKLLDKHRKRKQNE